MNSADLISNFIQTERNRFSDKRNNPFTMCFAQIRVYYDYLQIILGRYEIANDAFIENTKQTLDPEQIKEKGWDREKSYELQTKLHLEMESFYLFANILLDKIANGVLFYFGASIEPKDVEAHSQYPHRYIRKKFRKYAQQKGLSVVPKKLLSLIDEIHHRITIFRNQIVTHLN